MSDTKLKYTIDYKSKRVEKKWSTLEREYPERVAICKEFLQNNPEDRSKAIGILKKLKGRFKGTLQYDITKDDVRVWYIVDRKKRIVTIKYAGPHPDKY